MRLLNTKTIEVDEFLGSRIPPYAILSHTWGKDEVSLQDLQCKTPTKEGSSKEGSEKIVRCCEVALSHGFEHVWIDTCCIDKTSSAELSEAINSMFRWYQEAIVCYVILSDVPASEDFYEEDSAFRNSRWFKLGWTLQELIAPANVIFYGIGRGKAWQEIGTLSSLEDLIVEITGVHAEMLSGQKALEDFSVAQRMYWASSRETTRTEDIAYCLMGIFNVNMPLVYGEGDKAFFRLQEQILSASNDESILAWTSSSPSSVLASCLARSPMDFCQARDIVPKTSSPGNVLRSPINQGPINSPVAPWSLTNRGLHLPVEYFHYNLQNASYGGNTCVVLRCTGSSADRIGILVRQKADLSGVYYRNTANRPRDLIELSEQDLRRQKVLTASIYLFVHRGGNKTASYYSRRAYFVETRGLRENAIELIPTCIDTDDDVATAINLSSRLAVVVPWQPYVLQFSTGIPDLNINITIKAKHDSKKARLGAAAYVEYCDGDGRPYLQDLTSKSTGSLGSVFASKGSDRIQWHEPEDDVYIKVAVRPHKAPDARLIYLDRNGVHVTVIVNEAFKVEISWDKPGDDHTLYEPINIEPMLALDHQIEPVAE